MNKHMLARASLVCLLAFSVGTSVYAQDENMEVLEETVSEADSETSEAPTAASGGPLPAIYLPLKPAFVVNYGGKGPLRYLKTELAVRLSSTDVANSVRHHMPYIRNNLVMLFARMTEETINSQDGREQLRQDALAEIRKVVKEEDGIEGVVDVYFNTFIVQN